MKKISQILNSKNLKNAAIGSVLIKFLAAIFALLSSILLVRIMNIESYGYYILAYTVITVLSIPVSLGLPNLLVRYVSKYTVTGEKGKIKGLFIRANQVVLLSFLLIIFIASILYFIWWSTYSNEFIKTILIGFFVLLMMGLSAIRAATLRGLKFIILGQLPDTLIKNFIILIIVFIIYYNNIKIQPHNAMSIQAFATFTAFIVGYIIIHKKLLKNLTEIKSIYENKLWFKEAIPFTLNSGIQIIRSKTITFILATFGSIESVAIFDIATRGAALVSFTLDALNSAIAPYISSAYESHNIIKLQQIIKKTSRIIFVAALPIIFIFIFGGSNFVGNIFGINYMTAYIPLIIMAIGQLISSTTGSVGLVLSMTGHQKYFTNNNIIMTILNVILCIPFVIMWDVIGAAILFSLILIIQNITLFIHILKKIKINTTIF